MPPPAVLPLRVEPVTASVLSPLLEMPPPEVAELPLRTEPVTVSVPKPKL
jgi:hypothetical protein